MGLNLRPLREKTGKTIKEISAALGVTHPAYIKWETGQGYPSADKLPAIAALFGCRIDDLFVQGANLPDDTSIPEEVWRYHGV